MNRQILQLMQHSALTRDAFPTFVLGACQRTYLGNVNGIEHVLIYNIAEVQL